MFPVSGTAAGPPHFKDFGISVVCYTQLTANKTHQHKDAARGASHQAKKRNYYNCDFKRQTLALLDSGLTPAEVARRQNIRESNIYRWRGEFMVHSIDAIDALRSEIKRLRPPQNNAICSARVHCYVATFLCSRSTLGITLRCTAF